MKLHLTELT